MIRAFLMASLLLWGVERPRPPQRQPELFQQNQPPTAQGLWFDGLSVGVIGWQGQPVPCGAQVDLKGRNFVGRSVLVVLKYSFLSDLGEMTYLVPRISLSSPPINMDSCAFTLPLFVTGLVEVQLWVDGLPSNAVRFTVR